MYNIVIDILFEIELRVLSNEIYFYLEWERAFNWQRRCQKRESERKRPGRHHRLDAANSSHSNIPPRVNSKRDNGELGNNGGERRCFGGSC